MKLYDVPNNTSVRVLRSGGAPPGAFEVLEGAEVLFHHIDGMYSYCVDDNRDVVHLPAWAEVDIV